MTGWILRRVAQTIPLVWAVATALFIFLNFTPGGPVLALTGEFADADTVAQIQARLGLDRPIWDRYLQFLGLLATGNLGQSYTYSGSVTGLILEHLPATLILAIPAILLAALIGLPLGIYSARRTLPGDIAVAASVIVFAIPVFWLGHLLRLLPGVSEVFPVQGMTDSRSFHTGAALWLDIARHAALPILTLTLYQMAYTLLITRRALTAQMQRRYVMTARAKGASPARVEWHHALPNGAAPIIALFGNRVGWFLGGAILVEVVFAWPGLGQLTISALQNRDTPLVIGVVLTGTLFTVFGHLLADIAQHVLHARAQERDDAF